MAAITVSFRLIKPKPPPAFHAANMSSSASHSWFTHGTLLVKEYGSVEVSPCCRMSAPNRTWPHKSGSANVRVIPPRSAARTASRMMRMPAASSDLGFGTGVVVEGKPQGL